MFTLDVQPQEVRTIMVGTRMNRGEHQRLKDAARKRGLMVATVMRQLSLAWAEQVLSDAEAK